MYKIIKTLDGKFHCQCKVRQGVEQWIDDTILEALSNMKQTVEMLDHIKIKRSDIEIYEQKHDGTFVLQKVRNENNNTRNT